MTPSATLGRVLSNVAGVTTALEQEPNVMSAFFSTAPVHMPQATTIQVAGRLSTCAREGKRNEDGRPTERRGSRMT